MLSFIFKTVVILSLFSMVPASAIESFAPALSDIHASSVTYFTPVVDWAKNLLAGK